MNKTKDKVVSIKEQKGLMCFDCGKSFKAPQGFYLATIDENSLFYNEESYYDEYYHEPFECIAHLRGEIKDLRTELADLKSKLK